MNGIKLKSDELPKLAVERIKWIILIIISHLFSFLLFSMKSGPNIPELPSLSPGYVRLQLKLSSKIPEESLGQNILLMTKKRKLITNQAKLLKKVTSRGALESEENEYLIDIPESDLATLILASEKVFIAYPSSKNISISKKSKRSHNYEIHF